MAKKGSAYNNDNIYNIGVIRGALSMDVLSLIISKTIQRIGMPACLSNSVFHCTRSISER